MLSSQNSQISGDFAALKALKNRAGAKIADAIQNASSKTGVDFSYLLQQAQVESSFKADAKASSSSATGLYQFIESTWLNMVNKYGAKYGLSKYADQISDSGKVASKSARAEILKLRNDPKICSLMAGELASENKNYLSKCVGGDIGSTELYMAHFMGPGGAAKFLKALRSNPTASAAASFPQAAAANKNVFYTKSGHAKSMAEVYAFFDNKFQIESDVSGDTSAGACTAEAQQPAPVTQTASALPAVSDTNSLHEHSYNEVSKQWTRIRSSAAAPLATSWTPTENLGGIAGLRPAFVSPVDILELLKNDHSRDYFHQSRYNS